jgi:hypothetical protein
MRFSPAVSLPLRIPELERADMTDLDKFNAVLRKILSVPREELQRREAEWKQERARKKQAKISLASRASTSKD